MLPFQITGCFQPWSPSSLILTINGTLSQLFSYVFIYSFSKWLMSIFTIFLRIWAVDSTVTEKPNGRGRKAPLSLPSSSLTYKLWDPSAFMARPLPSPLVSPQKFLSLPLFMPQSHWTTPLCFPLSPAGWADFQIHFPRGTSRRKTSKTAGFPEHQPTAAYLNQEKHPNCTGIGKAEEVSHYEKIEGLGMKFRAGISGGHVIPPWNSRHKGGHFYNWGLCDT